jgi:hypothetical protein
MTNRTEKRVTCWSYRSALGLLCGVTLAGCGNVTAGGVSDAEVYMSGDASPQAAPAASEGARPAPARIGILTGVLEGDVDVDARIFLRRVGGVLVPLTPAGLSVTLDLAGVQQPLVADISVASGSFDAVVVRFTDVTAQVTGGLEIGGIPFVGSVSVDLGGPSLDVTELLTLELADEEEVELLVDLNADGWIPLLDVLTGLVAAADFAAAVAVSER